MPESRAEEVLRMCQEDEGLDLKKGDVVLIAGWLRVVVDRARWWRPAIIERRNYVCGGWYIEGDNVHDGLPHYIKQGPDGVTVIVLRRADADIKNESGNYDEIEDLPGGPVHYYDCRMSGQDCEVGCECRGCLYYQQPDAEEF